jgi:hypothetical protein
VVTKIAVKPVMLKIRAPILSKILPVIGDISPITTAPGNSIIPDSIAVKWRISCIYIGMIVAAPIIDIKTTIPIIVASVNIGYLNTLNSKIGSSKWSCLQIEPKQRNAADREASQHVRTRPARNTRRC